ncbi:DUF1345 domain-containing protein [Aquabacter sp. CN5-332]|uniref:DUF1345 domain-containing protein n=1 Tax=Aquabacter sp. CN5-332 TaxID=3156608 RepID=UPI0032B48072
MAEQVSSIEERGIGNVIAPPRFLLFACVLVVASTVAVWLFGWRLGIMIGFDIAAFVFLVSCWALLGRKPDDMREAARRNDANRVWLLALTFLVSLEILVVIANELRETGGADTSLILLIILTLALTWAFSNAVFTLHYAYLYYSEDEEEDNDDVGGLDFPECEEPGYWDFIYFSFCLGMTFQTSDVNVTNPLFRRVVTLHCLAAFVFNIGVLAFTINVLSG